MKLMRERFQWPPAGRDDDADYERERGDELVRKLVEKAKNRHDQHFGKIHSTWSKSIGLSSRRLARGNRYAPNDRLLKTLVVTVVDERMQFDEFLHELRRRYGIVIGDAEGAHLVNLADTLGHVTALGAKEFRANEDCWVEATCHVTGIAPAPEDRKIFLVALKGMLSSFDLSLHQIGSFCALVSEANTTQGQPIRESVGWALPAVGLPRDTSFFSSARTFGTAAGPWRKAFDKLFVNRYPLLSRLNSFKSELAQIKVFNKDINDTDGIVCTHVVIQVFRKQYPLGSIFSLHESLHRNTPVRNMRISYHRRRFYTVWVGTRNSPLRIHRR